MGGLTGRTVLITGAARGIGAASARRLAGEGARLVLADLDGPGVNALAAELGQVAIRADVTRPEDIERMVDEPYQRWGRLDVLFNNAGVIRVQPMLEVTRQEWDRVMDVNLRAVFFVLQAAARRMQDQDLIPGSELRGKLIQTASIASYRGGNHLMTPYSASKAGVVSLTRSAAQSLAAQRITSNCICPGAVETAMWEQIDREWGALEGLGEGEMWKRRIRGHPPRPPRAARGRRQCRGLSRRARLRLHDGPGHQCRWRRRDGQLKANDRGGRHALRDQCRGRRVQPTRRHAAAHAPVSAAGGTDPFPSWSSCTGARGAARTASPTS
jgi:NAD(P)-dependent dehydrogenase (short-subunit alcohol dehydrogenase family)